MSSQLSVTSRAFSNNGTMPLKYTGYGVDQSPPFTLKGLTPEAEALAIILVDMDVPHIKPFPHWLIWNLPVKSEIPGNLPPGEILGGYGDAKQGAAYGNHCYRGPKPPKFAHDRHHYVFTIYALDQKLALSASADRDALLAAMKGHILQEASITGIYQNEA